MMKKLLLADDSITIQKVVGIIFSTEDYQLEMTDNGDSAFEMALAERPDLVIADISMPGKDGFELCRAIKREPGLSRTSVLLLPGAFDHFDQTKAAEVCADGWLTKPFESQALLDKVAQLLDAEPLRMAGVALTDSEEAGEVPADLEGSVDIVAASSINDSVLGLDEVDEFHASDQANEESPDDIWDAVSFAEDELQPGADAEVGSIDSVAADIFGDETSVDTPSSEFTAAGTEESTAPVAEKKPTFVDETSESEMSDDEQPAIEPLDDTSNSPSSMVAEEGNGQFSEADNDEFSSFITEQDDLTDPIDSFVDETSPFIAEVAEEDSFDVVANVEEPSEEIEDSAPVETVSFTETAPLDVPPLERDATDLDEPEVETETSAFVDISGEEEPLELSADDEVYEFEGTAEPAPLVSEVVEEEALDLAEEDDVEESGPVVLPEDVSASETDPIVDTAVEEIVEEPNEEILDLSVDDIVADVEESDVVEGSPMTDENLEEFDAGEEEITELTETAAVGGADSSENIAVVEDVDIIQSDEEIAPLEEGAEVTFVDESVAVVSAETDEEEFFFDETEEEVVEPDVVATDDRMAVAADDSSTMEQVEQQLRELSEQELKDIVAKVAGSMIEKLAGEMLEKIAWEVVPDLAEAMIDEEIRKIKEGTD